MRLSLDRELARQFARLEPGVVLDVGAKGSPYRALIPHERYMRLDVDAARAPDIRCDVHELGWQPDYFDTVLLIEVLEHLYDPARAVDRLLAVLKPGGVCIASTPFLYRYHADPHDYFRFTWDSLGRLFGGFRKVEIHHHGGRLQVIWELVNAGGRSRALLNLLNPLVARIPARRTRFPLGFVVYAEK